MILAINKIDTLEDKSVLLACIDAWRKEADFAAVLPLSALTGEGVDDLVAELSAYAFESPHFFPDDSGKRPAQEQVLAAELLREKMLLSLREEIPHGIAVTIESMHERETERGPILDIEANIFCEKASHKGMIIGKRGTMLKEIASAARLERRSCSAPRSTYSAGSRSRKTGGTGRACSPASDTNSNESVR